MAITPLTLGALSEKIGKNKVILIAFGLMITGTVFAGAARNLVLFLIGSFLIGAGFSVLEATLSAVLADEFPNESVRHLNFSQVAFSFGALLSPALAAGMIRKNVYFQNIYFIAAGFFAVLGGICYLSYRRTTTIANNTDRITEQFSGFFHNRGLLLLAIAVCIYVGVENTTANFTEVYFHSKLDLAAYSAIALSIYWGAMIPSRYLAGTLKLNIKTMLIVSCSITFLGLIAAMLLTNPIAKLAMVALCGFGCGPIWPLLMNQASKENQGSSGLIMNVMFSFCAMGRVLLPILAGFVSDVGDVGFVYYLCAGAIVAVLLISSIAERRKARLALERATGAQKRQEFPLVEHTKLRRGRQKRY